MSFFNRHGRALLFAAVVTVGAVCVVGAAEKPSVFTDSRDGQKYRAVKIGGKTWMAQNLNYRSKNSWCYGGKNSNCEKYGRLYDWKAAKTACPSGWHLPSREEWNELVAVDSVDGMSFMAKSGWRGGEFNISYDGTDDYGFSALPGGYYNGESFDKAGSFGYWWTATEIDGDDAYCRDMIYGDGNVYELTSDKSHGYSVRCLGD